jgi:hypothetical protein
MAKTIEYRAVPHTVWTVVRYEKEDDGPSQGGGSSQCGEFPNEKLANRYGAMIAASELGAVYLEQRYDP